MLNQLPDGLLIEGLKLLPSLLWFLLIVTLVIIFYWPVRYELLPKLSGFKGLGIEFSFVQDSLNQAIDQGHARSEDVDVPVKSSKWNIKVPPEAREQVLRRMQRNTDIFRGAQMLWVDDCPENNVNERRIFRRLHVDIDTARTTGDALAMLQHASYDLVLSDIDRDGDPRAGLTFLERYRQQHPAGAAVIFYIGTFDPARGVPPGAFGITNRPDELIHLVLDLLERLR